MKLEKNAPNYVKALPQSIEQESLDVSQLVIYE